MVEYVIVVGFIAAVALLAVSTFGAAVVNLFVGPSAVL